MANRLCGKEEGKSRPSVGYIDQQPEENSARKRHLKNWRFSYNGKPGSTLLLGHFFNLDKHP